MLLSDTKASSQFILNAVEQKDIVLKVKEINIFRMFMLEMLFLLFFIYCLKEKKERRTMFLQKTLIYD